ncbi:aminodeoxychorismate lyase [Idiomarina sp. MD25a]|uniref:aminodeoxychorismate lyase n=1 Tax=Idiomarina sp. MD25a TaxID=1889913 RepID=UPI0008F865EB|nr:aminodeoxychorismate lyase [Idiomarina sp. MD25a]OIN02109.1 aminodeoxychorismate lyase [Idiomarina sp. MD25a]
MFDTLYDADKGFDRGLQFGDGHFTTILFKHKQLQLWPYHKQRLIGASERLGIPLDDRLLKAIENSLLAACREQVTGVAKIIITRGNSRQGYRLLPDCQPNWYLTTSAAPQPNKSPVKVAVADTRLGEQPLLAGLKTLNRLEQVLLHKELSTSNFDDFIVCSSNGYVTEAIQGNLFWYADGYWCTPKIDRCGVAGVMREAIIEQGVLPALKVVEAKVPDLCSVSSMFITNSVKGVIPVSQIHDKVINTQIPADLKTFIDETCA